jgi:hypothetical protein
MEGIVYDHRFRANKLACNCSVGVEVCLRNQEFKMTAKVNVHRHKFIAVKCPMVSFTVNIIGDKNYNFIRR